MTSLSIKLALLCIQKIMNLPVQKPAIHHIEHSTLNIFNPGDKSKKKWREFKKLTACIISMVISLHA